MPGHGFCTQEGLGLTEIGRLSTFFEWQSEVRVYCLALPFYHRASPMKARNQRVIEFTFVWIGG